MDLIREVISLLKEIGPLVQALGSVGILAVISYMFWKRDERREKEKKQEEVARNKELKEREDERREREKLMGERLDQKEKALIELTAKSIAAQEQMVGAVEEISRVVQNMERTLTVLQMQRN